MFQIDVKTHNRVEMIDITKNIQDIVKKSKIKSGLCIVFCPHTTAGLTINENADPAVKSDIVMETNKIIPFDNNYKHMEGNAAAHIKSTFYGQNLTLLIEDSELKLGTWQGIYFCEFDGPRRRKVWVKIVRD